MAADYKDIVNFTLLLRPYWKNIIIFILTGLVLTLLSLPYPWLTKIMIDDVMLRQDNSLLYVILGATFILTVFRSLFSSLQNYYISYIQHAMAYDIEMKFIGHLHRLSFSFYNSKEVAEILSRFTDAAQSRTILIDVINRIVNNLLYLSIVPAIVFMMNWKLALMAGVTLPWLAFSFFVLSKIVRRYARLSAEKRAELSAKSYEALSGIREIQSLSIENRILNRIKILFLNFRRIDMEMGVISNIQGLLGSIATAVGTLLYTWFGALQVINGGMTVGELIAFTTFIGYLYNPLTDMVGLLVPIQEVVVYAKRFHEIYDIQPQISSPENSAEIEKLEGNIIFSGVSFKYETSDKKSLDRIDLKIPAGSTVALVGKTGSGKSTLVSLIPRFYDPIEGTVAIDGTDIRAISLKTLRSQIGTMSQTPFTFTGTIYENITCWKKGFTQNDVIAAARAAHIHDFVSGLPKGYETLVGEKGETLSGGERQRMALARIILLNRPILILDEALSAVDQKTENLIRSSLKQLRKDRTILMVTHKMEMAKDADMIVVMEEGRIVEQGTHDELFKKDGVYTKLCTGN